MNLFYFVSFLKLNFPQRKTFFKVGNVLQDPNGFRGFLVICFILTLLPCYGHNISTYAKKGVTFELQ